MGALMLKKLFTGSVLAACCAFAQAAAVPATWNFTWTGFEIDGRFRPDVSYSGSFTGVDANHNGTIELSELSVFGIDPLSRGDSNFFHCKTGTFPAAECKVNTFSYVIGGQLSFDAYRKTSYDYPGEYPAEATYGFDTSYGASYEGHQGMFYEWGVYYVTPKTVLTVQPTLAPVPEPEGYAMLGAGLLVLAGLRSRKKKQ